MDRNKDKLFSDSLGKTISIYYNDTLNTVSFKIGKFTDFDEQNIKLFENSNNTPTLIPRNKCIRIEIRGKQHVQATAR